MKRILLLFLIAGYTMDIRAQIPVVDVAALTEAIATVTELRRQVDLILREIALSTEIRQNTQDHLDRYERALSKRGIIPSEALGTYVRRIRQAHQASGGVNWENSVLSQLVWLCYFRRLAHLSDQMPGTSDQHALLDSLRSFPQASPVGAVIALRMLAGMIR